MVEGRTGDSGSLAFPGARIIGGGGGHRQGSWEGTEGTERPWNRLRPEEEAVVLAAAREMPPWRSRQLAAWLSDHRGLSVSASTVYRILRREGLVKRIEYQLAAGKEYQHKTTGPHQLWATDASYFRVVGWGYYYLVTVMDDYSRFILAWKVQRDMTANSLIEVVQEAVDSTGMTDVPLEDRTKLLSNNGLRLCIAGLPRVHAGGGHSPRPGSTLSPSDQREAGEISPNPERRH